MVEACQFTTVSSHRSPKECRRMVEMCFVCADDNIREAALCVEIGKKTWRTPPGQTICF